MAQPSPAPRILAVALAAAALCWTALVNGQPFFHPDTLGYVRGPDVAVMKLLGPRFASPWARLDPKAKVDALAQATAPGVAGQAAQPPKPDTSVMGGRSIYYGVLADLGARSGGFWLTVLIQALAVAWLAEITLRAAGVCGLGAYAAAIAVLALASPAGLFADFLMPDIWVGVGVGALALLLAAPGRLSRLDVAVLGLMLAFAALAHSTAPLVITAMLGAGVILKLLRPDSWRLRTGLIAGLAGLAVAMAGGLAFTAMVRHATGEAPINPPFLTARVVADGTGALYAKTRCAGAFAVCRYADRLPLDVDHFLWGETARDGVFLTVPLDDRRALSRQDAGFALATARAYPLQQVLASLDNAWAQVWTTELSDFNYKPSLQDSFGQTLPAGTIGAMSRTLAWRQAWPLGLMWVAQTAALAILVGAAALSAGGRGTPPTEAVAAARRLMLLALAGVLANGAICGVFSTLYGRYQARVAWVLPLAALAWLLARREAGKAARE